MDRTTKVVGDARCGLGEGLIWHPGDAAMWWTDIPARRLLRFCVDSGAETIHALDRRACALAAGPGRMVDFAGDGGFWRYDPRSGRAACLAAVAMAEGMRFNDGAADPAGRFWAGTMDEAGSRSGLLWCLDGDVLSGPFGGPAPLRVVNGIAFSWDGSWMYLSDSHASVATIWRARYDMSTGRPAAWSLLHRAEPSTGRPDGAAVSEDGSYWSAAVGGGALLRLEPSGRVAARIEIGVRCPTRPAFGGVSLSRLFVATMGPPKDNGAHAGKLLEVIGTGARGCGPCGASTRSAPAAGGSDRQ